MDFPEPLSIGMARMLTYLIELTPGAIYATMVALDKMELT